MAVTFGSDRGKSGRRGARKKQAYGAGAAGFGRKLPRSATLHSRFLNSSRAILRSAQDLACDSRCAHARKAERSFDFAPIGAALRIRQEASPLGYASLTLPKLLKSNPSLRSGSRLRTPLRSRPQSGKILRLRAYRRCAQDFGRKLPFGCASLTLPKRLKL
jgi:hypothetical protein